MDYKYQFTRYIVKYYLDSGRQFAWRENRTPWRIYLSEILLQRTKAEQAEPVFIEITKKFRDINNLFCDFASAKEIMKSLGRFCRLEPFHEGLSCLVNKYNGVIPEERKDLLAVPSIGPYIAAAIRIFGYNVRDVIIDTNVVRVLGRFYGLRITPETRRRKSFIQLAEQHVPQDNFIEYSYGILDFAAQICRSVNPKCNSCILAVYCEYGKSRRCSDC